MVSAICGAIRARTRRSQQRERERERCVSDADASSNDPHTGARRSPSHLSPTDSCKNNPSSLDPALSPTSPDKRLTSTQKINPNLNLFPCPHPRSTCAKHYMRFWLTLQPRTVLAINGLPEPKFGIQREATESCGTRLFMPESGGLGWTYPLFCPPVRLTPRPDSLAPASCSPGVSGGGRGAQPACAGNASSIALSSSTD